MSNPYTYTLLPDTHKGVICSHYGTPQQRSDWKSINGYCVLDCGEVADMEQKHNAIWQVCNSHSYPQEIIDVLKVPPAKKQAETDSHAHALATVGPAPDIDAPEMDQYRTDYNNAYDAVYPTKYSEALASVVVNPAELSHDQARDFVKAYKVNMGVR